MELERIRLSKISQRKTDTIWNTWNLKNKTNEQRGKKREREREREREENQETDSYCREQNDGYQKGSG